MNFRKLHRHTCTYLMDYRVQFQNNYEVRPLDSLWGKGTKLSSLFWALSKLGSYQRNPGTNFWSLLAFTLAYTHSSGIKESIAERQCKWSTVFCVIILVSDFQNKINQRRQSARNNVTDKKVKEYPHEGEWKGKWEFEKGQRRLDLNIDVPCYSCARD